MEARVLRDHAGVDGVDRLAHGTNVELVAAAEFLKNADHGAWLAACVVEGTLKRLNTGAEAFGRLAKDAPLVPDQGAFNEVFHVVIEHSIGNLLLAREVVVHQLARDSYLLGNVFHRGAVDALSLVEASGRLYDLPLLSLEAPALHGEAAGESFDLAGLYGVWLVHGTLSATNRGHVRMRTWPHYRRMCGTPLLVSASGGGSSVVGLCCTEADCPSKTR